MVGCDLVALGEECCVGVERRPRLAMTETAGHGAQVAAGADELGGGEVTKVVQACLRDARSLRYAPERAGRLVGPVRARAVGSFGQHEGARVERGVVTGRAHAPPSDDAAADGAPCRRRARSSAACATSCRSRRVGPRHRRCRCGSSACARRSRCPPTEGRTAHRGGRRARRRGVRTDRTASTPAPRPRGGDGSVRATAVRSSACAVGVAVSRRPGSSAAIPTDALGRARRATPRGSDGSTRDGDLRGEAGRSRRRDGTATTG